jgi:UDP-N-acetylmuramoylalanine--D-glutamate ligase
LNIIGKKVAVIGLGVSNTPLIRFLDKAGAQITVFDKKEAEQLREFLQQLEGLKLRYSLGPSYLEALTDVDLIFLTPGMRKNLPELEKARAAGAVFSSEIEVFLEHCPGRIIGITGSSGKTTTTTLIGEMMAADFPNVFVGGNIGCSLLDELPSMSADSQVVLELSSFQLQELKISPHLAVVTNITPNHLDMHASMAEYISAKTNILRFQQSSDQAILNHDNEIAKSLAREAKGRVYYFSRAIELPEGAFLKETELMLNLDGKTEFIADRAELKLLGDHNVENVLTAALAARLSGASLTVIRKVALEFTGVEHRLELVREYRGIRFYNDSISTTPDRAIAGIKAMNRPIVLIAGGYDKHLPFESLAREIVNCCRYLVVLGDTAPQITAAVKALRSDFIIEQAASFEKACKSAFSAAGVGDAVLLSPACASYDMFNNYQERGRLFKQLALEWD